MSNFEFTVPIFKAAEGAEGQWRFEGRASTTAIDRQGERMSETAIQGFKEQMFVPLCYGDDHKGAVVNVMSEIGKIDAVGGDAQTFEISGEIDKTHPYAEFLYSKLQNGQNPADWKLSVGGRIPETGKRLEWDSDAGAHVTVIDEFMLDHVFLCRGNAAVNQDTVIRGKGDWGDEVFKAAAEIVVDESKREDSSSHKAEDTLEADSMPEQDAVVPVADEGEEKVTVGLIKTILDTFGLGAKADEEAPIEPVEEPAPEYVTKEQLADAMKGLGVEVMEGMKAAMEELAAKLTPPEVDAAEKSEEVAEEDGKTEDPPADEPPVEDPPAVVDDEAAGKSTADFNTLVAAGVASEMAKRGGVSAQIPLIGEAGKAAPADDGYPDVLGVLPPEVIQPLVRTICRPA